MFLIDESGRKRLGKFFRECRIKKGLTQMEVGKCLGLTRAQYVSNWECGKCTPPINKMKVLQNLYGLKTEQLIQIWEKEAEKVLKNWFKSNDE